MSKKKIVLAVAAVLAGAGAIAAVSAQGPRGGHGRGAMHDDGHGGLERRGWFRSDVTKDAYDTRVRERFAALDRNSDGVIDTAELNQMIEQRATGMRDRMRALRGGGEAGNPMLQRLDTNRDGKVTREEVQDRLRKAFADADLDSDGKISDADLPPKMRGSGMIARLAANESPMGGHGMRGGRGEGRGGMDGFGGGGGALMRLVQGAEVKDGAVTLDAVLAAGLRRHDRFDRNKDGALDKADTDSLRKDMTEYRVKRFLHAHGTKDGKVTREQFFAKAGERFATMDLNGDGKLGRGEVGGRHGMRHEGRHGGEGRGERGPRGDGGSPGMQKQ